ncbi:lysophospholipase L1-like esterase [Marmoricola sp. URHA0025 HA25]
MRRTFSAAAVTVAVAATTLVTAPGPASGDDPGSVSTSPVRVMLAGDSITQGFDGDFTWRYRLFQEFGRQQVPVDFVGPRRYPYGGHDLYLTTGWDSDHDALGGSTLAGSVASIGPDVAAYLPDVLVAEYGTNDLVGAGASPAALLDSWRAYVANARAAQPNLKVVLGEVATPKARTRAEANAGLHVLAAELTTDQSPVVVADLDSPDWSPSRDTRDLVHPNPTGETVIAQKMAEALAGLGVLPGVPEVARAFVPWTPPLEPVVHRSGHRLSIEWARSRKLYRVHEVRVRVTSLRTGRSRTWTYARRPTRLVTSALRPGRYRIVLRGSRGTTSSLWGVPVVRRVG